MRIRSVLKHSAQALAEGSLIALLVVGLMAGSVFAAKGGNGGKPGGGGGTTSGTCWVNPNPVAIGADYTLTGAGLGAYAVVNVLITDSGNTTSWNLMADASGTAAVTWHAYWTGTTSVSFLKSSRHGSTTVASCSFAVY
jgi:hypothetical protein